MVAETVARGGALPRPLKTAISQPPREERMVAELYRAFIPPSGEALEYLEEAYFTAECLLPLV